MNAVSYLSVPASFTTKLSATSKLGEGDRLLLWCNVTGAPMPLVKWYKDGRRLTESSRIHFHVNGSEHKLVVKNLVLLDRGVYQCETGNEYGSSIDQTMLNVMGRYFQVCNCLSKFAYSQVIKPRQNLC